MIPKVDILKIARKALRRKQGTVDTRIMHPLRDWAVGLLAVLLIFIVASAYALYVFLDLLRSIDEPVQIERSVVTYKQERALKVFETYRERVRQFESLRAVRIIPLLPEAESENSEPEEEPEAIIEESVMSE